MRHASTRGLHTGKKFIKSSFPCLCISVAFLSIQFFIISIARFITPPPIIAVSDCPSGRFYIYDLPSSLNHELLLHNCTDLNAQNSRCGIAPNHGFGSPAAEFSRLLPETMSAPWFRTSQFALEVIFHRRILQHRCRTPVPESAAAFYIPFYAGLAFRKYMFTDDPADRDRLAEAMLRWVRRRAPWRRSNGSDHFITVGRVTWDFRREDDSGWGSTFFNMPEMQRVTRLIIEKAVWDHRDVAVPYPTGFHPESEETIKRWQDFARGYKRPSLFALVGAARPEIADDFRGILMSYCSDESPLCRLVDCTTSFCMTDYSVIIKTFLGAEFCLQPKGDSATRRSVFDCIIAGSVPIFFSSETAYDQYVWFLPGEPESYSIYIDEKEVRNRSSVVKEVLMRYSKEEIRRKREKVIETIPRIIYGGGSPDFEDAFDISLHGVLERIKREKEKIVAD